MAIPITAVPPSPESLAREVRRWLQANANPKIAAQTKNYFKSYY